MVDTPIVSEALQKDFRDNFPSQINSGRDLHVSDVIVPVVDFSTSTAITGLPESLQQALDFTSTAFKFSGTATNTIVATTGFWKVQGYYIKEQNITSAMNIFITDGVTDLIIIDAQTPSNAVNSVPIVPFEFLVLLKTGVSLKCLTNDNQMQFSGICRQVAALDGTLQNPDGYIKNLEDLELSIYCEA